MKKEVVIELIEDNRLKEAIDLLKEETKETYLYNQVILLSASYEDYLKLEIMGLEDYSVRSQKRAQLVNALLLTVDKIYEHPPTPLPKTISGKPKLRIDAKYVKVASMGLGGFVLLAILFYFMKNRDAQLPEISKASTAKFFDLEIKVVNNAPDSLFTEGGKIKLKIEGMEDKTLILNTEGKAYLPTLPIELKDKKLDVQFEDTNYYMLVQPEVSVADNIKTVKAVAKTQTISFSGRLVRFDMQAVKNATLVFNNGAIKAITNENGEYTVQFPKKMVGTTVELSIIKNNKVSESHFIMVNGEVLSSLKAK